MLNNRGCLIDLGKRSISPLMHEYVVLIHKKFCTTKGDIATNARMDGQLKKTSLVHSWLCCIQKSSRGSRIACLF